MVKRNVFVVNHSGLEVKWFQVFSAGVTFTSDIAPSLWLSLPSFFPLLSPSSPTVSPPLSSRVQTAAFDETMIKQLHLLSPAVNLS